MTKVNESKEAYEKQQRMMHSIMEEQGYTFHIPMSGEAICRVTADTPEKALDIIRKRYDDIRAWSNPLAEEGIIVTTRTFPVIDLTNDGYADFCKSQLEDNELVVTDHKKGKPEIMRGLRKEL
jgi:hypothetical protein